MKKGIFIINILFLINIIKSESKEKLEESQEELKSCEQSSESNKENTFLLKTNLSENEIEEILSKDFSLSNNKIRQNKRRSNTNNDVKQFKSKDHLNKTILLLEINNISEITNHSEKGIKQENHSKEKPPYELIDIKPNNEIKIFLSFDKFFKSQYKEMFDYSYTILIAIFVFIGMFIYYAFLLPNEANEMSRNRIPNENFNSQSNNINNDNGNELNYIFKE